MNHPTERDDGRVRVIALSKQRSHEYGNEDRARLTNGQRKECMGTHAIYWCTDMDCPWRDACKKAVSPWKAHETA